MSIIVALWAQAYHRPLQWGTVTNQAVTSQQRAGNLDAVVGLGANLGDRAQALVQAAVQLQEHAEITALSGLYRSVPVGGPPQPDFFNAAARLSFQGDARQLLTVLLAIEQAQGRTRTERWGPRTLDLDLLWIAGLQIESADLVVPHPRLTQRAFALVPLISLVPTACHPTTGQSYVEHALIAGVQGLELLTHATWDALRVRL